MCLRGGGKGSPQPGLPKTGRAGCVQWAGGVWAAWALAGSWEASLDRRVLAQSWWGPCSLPRGEVAQEGCSSLGLWLVPCSRASNITAERVPGSLPAPGVHSSPTGVPGLNHTECPPSVPGHTAPALPRPFAPGELLSARSPLATSAQAEHGAAQPPAYLLPYVQLSRDGTNAENMALSRSRHVGGWERRGSTLASSSPATAPGLPPPPRGCHHRQRLRGTRGTQGRGAGAVGLWNLQMLSCGCRSHTAQVQKCSPG